MTRSLVVARHVVLVVVAGLALASCQNSSGRPSMRTAPTTAAVRAFCGGATATPTTAEEFRLLTVRLNEGEQGLAGVASAEQFRFSTSAGAYVNAANQELSYLQGRSTATTKQQLDTAFESARQALLSTCKSLPARLLAGQPLPLPKARDSLDSYCRVAALPHTTPTELVALEAAAEPPGVFRSTTRNRAIADALTQVSFAASYSALSASESPAQKAVEKAAISKRPEMNLPLTLANLRAACR